MRLASRRAVLRASSARTARVSAASLATRRLASSEAAVAPDLARKLQDTTTGWAKRWAGMVEYEQSQETETIRQRIASWSNKRLRTEGIMLQDMHAQPFAPNIMRFVAQDDAGSKMALPEHKLSTGDAVLVCRGSARDKMMTEGRERFEGVVVRSTSGALHVQTGGEVQVPEDVFEGQWRLYKGANAVSTQRQIVALEKFMDAEPGVACDSRVQMVLLGEGADGVMASLKLGDTASLAAEMPSGVPSPFRVPADKSTELDMAEISLEHADEAMRALVEAASLNESQREALVTSLSQRVTLIQGPPGTGKTHTAVQLLKMAAAAQGTELEPAQSKGQVKKKGKKAAAAARRAAARQAALQQRATILAAANSNTAADNLLEGLLREGVRVVRVGQHDRVRPSCQHVTMQSMIENHGARAIEQQLEQTLRELALEVRGGPTRKITAEEEAAAELKAQQEAVAARRAAALPPSMRGLASSLQFDSQASGAFQRERSAGELYDKLERGREQLDALRAEMVDDIMASVDVVVATCIAAGELQTSDFKTVLLDESSQSTEPTCIVPIAKGCRRLVLVGDSNQLPPTVKTDAGMSGGLGVSLFEKLQGLGVEPKMLDTQYRMHPAIAKFPSAQFYEGRLKDADNVASLRPPLGFPWPDARPSIDLEEQSDLGALSPVGFVPVRGRERASTDGNSKLNHDEAHYVVSVVRELLAAGELGATDIGVVTPYTGQVRLIRKMLAECAEAEDAAEAEQQLAFVEVNSVDGYQGREKDVIVASTVRANDKQQVGFLADWRRLNVALTRARRGLVVLGDPDTLSADRTWRAWLAHARTENCLVALTAPEGVEARPLPEVELVADGQPEAHAPRRAATMLDPAILSMLGQHGLTDAQQGDSARTEAQQASAVQKALQELDEVWRARHGGEGGAQTQPPTKSHTSR